jgi:methylated-DNA-[protein]-cysteine S-methyltransferase
VIFTRRILVAGKLIAAVLWTKGENHPLVKRVCIDGKERFGDEATCAAIEDLAERITAFLEGETVTVPLGLADMDECGEFQRSVLLLECTVPRGRITTYGRIARKLGSGARAVGNALARNPFPLIIPCHRAVKADLSIGGFQGGTEMKRTLLVMEGVILDTHGRIAESNRVWDFSSENKEAL